jgi:hypothetical protein
MLQEVRRATEPVTALRDQINTQFDRPHAYDQT